MSELRILTSSHDGRILTNNHIWTPDSRNILFDTRSDRLGDIFDGHRIMQLDTKTGAEQCLYLSTHGACCGVVTSHPFDDRMIFIAGPENPTDDWSYGPSHRQGLISHRSTPQKTYQMDARDLTTQPITGALRGGTHVHVWHPNGDWIRSTYNDALIHSNIRDIAVHMPGQVDVMSTHPRNHSGTYHSFIVTDTVTNPKTTDEITRAYEETWLGSRKQLAFMADTLSNGESVTEIYTVDVSGLSLGSKHRFDIENRIKPPAEVRQKRVTYLAPTSLRIAKKPRHWLVSSPSGETVAVLLKHNRKPAQLYTLDLASLELTQRTSLDQGIETALSWSADGQIIAFGSGNTIFTLDTEAWKVRRISDVHNGELLPLCCCISPDSRQIAVQIRISDTNHIACVALR